MQHERLVLLLESVRTYLNACSDSCRRNRHPVRQNEVSGAVIELLCAMRLEVLLQLRRVSVRSSGPLECLGRKYACHGVVRMARQTSVRAEGQDDMRAQPANPEHQVSDDLVEVGPVELAVGIIQYFTMRDTKKFARIRRVRRYATRPVPRRSVLSRDSWRRFQPSGKSLKSLHLDRHRGKAFRRRPRLRHRDER